MDAAMTSFVVPIIHGGGITEAARVYGGLPRDWLDLSTGINPCPPPLPFIPPEAWHRLPDRHLVDGARQAAKGYYAASSCMPLAAPGTQSVIQHLPRLADAGRRVAILSPTYGEYARVFSAAGFDCDPVSDLSYVTAEHGLVIVVNPNNPTGKLIPRRSLLALAHELSSRGARLHVDEAFGDGDSHESLSGDAGAVAGLTVFRSFGKFFGLAGLRLGFVLAEQPVLDQFESWLGPWPVSGPALVIAHSFMTADTAPVRIAIGQRNAGLRQALDTGNLTVVGGSKLFLLVEHPKAEALHTHLCRSHILVRKFDYNSQWLRFGLTPDEAADERLSAALAEFKS